MCDDESPVLSAKGGTNRCSELSGRGTGRGTGDEFVGAPPIVAFRLSSISILKVALAMMTQSEPKAAIAGNSLSSSLVSIHFSEALSNPERIASGRPDVKDFARSTFPF